MAATQAGGGGRELEGPFARCQRCPALTRCHWCRGGDGVRVPPRPGAGGTFVSGDGMTAALCTRLVLYGWAARPR